MAALARSARSLILCLGMASAAGTSMAFVPGPWFPMRQRAPRGGTARSSRLMLQVAPRMSSRHLPEGGDEASSMLLEAKQQIAHIGDVENIGLYVKMLKVAKEALVGELQAQSGLLSPMSASLIAELAQVNPLSQPARDNLMARTYELVSCPRQTEDACSALALGATLSFALASSPALPAPQAESGNKKKAKRAPRDQRGTVSVSIKGGAAAGGNEVHGVWESVARDLVQLRWAEGDGPAGAGEAARQEGDGCVPEDSGATLRVSYLDRELLILTDADKNTQPASTAWVLTSLPASS